MTETWEVAELLEEIAKKADARAVWGPALVANIAGNGKKSARYSIHVDLNGQLAMARYAIPVACLMEDVNGTPEEVLEWLKTGAVTSELDAVQIEIKQMDGGRMFLITQILTGKMFADICKLMTDDRENNLRKLLFKQSVTLKHR